MYSTAIDCRVREDSGQIELNVATLLEHILHRSEDCQRRPDYKHICLTVGRIPSSSRASACKNFTSKQVTIRHYCTGQKQPSSWEGEDKLKTSQSVEKRKTIGRQQSHNTQDTSVHTLTTQDRQNPRLQTRHSHKRKWQNNACGRIKKGQRTHTHTHT